MAAEAAAQQPVSAQVVGNAFVQQYYHILHHSPGLVYRFYQDVSKLGRPEHDGSMSITKTMQAINDKIVSLNYDNYRAEIKSIDAQDSFQGGVQVLVTGYLTGKDNAPRNFAQTFFLAPQDKGYYVLNDMFRYLDIPNVNPPPLVNHVVLPASAEPVPAPQVQEEILVPQQGTPPAEEVTGGEVYNPPENGDIPIVQDEEEEEEEPVADVVDEVQDDTQVVVESNAKIEDAPKKSYASIVMHLKESAGSFSPPPAAARRAPPKNVEQVDPALVPATDGQVSSAESVDDGNHQEGEDGHSVYIKGLPMTASETLLEEIFKQFGVIKIDGIQVRSNRQQGFCFGFVEYEEASSVQKAIEASPIAMGGRQVFIEEKRSTNSRGNNRGRFQPGRSSGFRSDGGRGRGNYGGGRGYNRGDFNGRSDFNNRGGHRGGSANRDGYQRSENFHNGGHVNRTGGIGNGSAKTAAPRVPATA